MIEDGVHGDSVTGSHLPQELHGDDRSDFVVLAACSSVLSSGQSVHVPEEMVIIMSLKTH